MNLAELERLNAELKAQVAAIQRKATVRQPKVNPLSDNTDPIYLQTVNSPGFAAYCRRRWPSTMWGERVKPPIPTFAQACKSRAGSIRAFMRPKGLNTLIGPYTTGRVIRFGHDCEDPNCPDCSYAGRWSETLKLKKLSKEEFVSEEPSTSHKVVGEWRKPKWWWEGKWVWQQREELARKETEKMAKKKKPDQSTVDKLTQMPAYQEAKAAQSDPDPAWLNDSELKTVDEVLAMVEKLTIYDKIVVKVANRDDEREALLPVCWDWEEKGDVLIVTIDKSIYDEKTKGAA